MTQVKKLDFRDTTIFFGIDVHKKSWRVNISDNELEYLPGVTTTYSDI